MRWWNIGFNSFQALGRLVRKKSNESSVAAVGAGQIGEVIEGWIYKADRDYKLDVSYGVIEEEQWKAKDVCGLL